MCARARVPGIIPGTAHMMWASVGDCEPRRGRRSTGRLQERALVAAWRSSVCRASRAPCLPPPYHPLTRQTATAGTRLGSERRSPGGNTRSWRARGVSLRGSRRWVLCPRLAVFLPCTAMTTSWLLRAAQGAVRRRVLSAVRVSRPLLHVLLLCRTRSLRLLLDRVLRPLMRARPSCWGLSRRRRRTPRPRSTFWPGRFIRRRRP